MLSPCGDRASGLGREIPRLAPSIQMAVKGTAVERSQVQARTQGKPKARRAGTGRQWSHSHSED